MLKAAITTPLALRGRLRSNGTGYPNREGYILRLSNRTLATPSISENTPAKLSEMCHERAKRLTIRRLIAT